MATSGTTDFNITGGSLIPYAFSLCGIRRPEITAEHMADGRLALNLLQASWGNDTPNLWTIDLVSVPLVASTATYDVDPDTIMVLDAYIRTGSGDTQNDRIIWPISRTEYAAMPNKSLEAQPTSFWFNRLLAPTITMWPVPDDQDDYTLQYYRCVVMDDAEAANGVTLDIPRWWQLAIAVGLAELLSLSYAKDRYADLQKKAADLLLNAREQDVENVPMSISPGVSSYWPR